VALVPAGTGPDRRAGAIGPLHPPTPASYEAEAGPRRGFLAPDLDPKTTDAFARYAEIAPFLNNQQSQGRATIDGTARAIKGAAMPYPC